jgi:hypothetical protein
MVSACRWLTQAETCSTCLGIEHCQIRTYGCDRPSVLTHQRHVCQLSAITQIEQRQHVGTPHQYGYYGHQMEQVEWNLLQARQR